MPNSTSFQPVKAFSHIKFGVKEGTPHLHLTGKTKRLRFGRTFSPELLSYGIVRLSETRRNFTIHIQGDRKIVKAINILLGNTNNESKYPPDENIAQLRQYQQTCLERYRQKIPRNPTRLSKPITAYSDTTITHPTIREGLHDIRFLQKNAGSNTSKIYLYKANPSNRPISEIEAFNAECYRVLLGINRHPKVRPIHNQDGQPAGTLSTYIPGFTTLGQQYKKHPHRQDCYLKNQQTITPSMMIEQLNKAKITDIWVAAYLEEENDLHDGNYGFTSTGDSSKVDDDRATWPLTCELAFDGGLAADDDTTYPQCAPNRASILTARDLKALPGPLKDARIRFISTGQHGKLNQNIIKALVDHPETEKRKYYLLLKRAVMPDEIYAAFGDAFIRNEKIRAQYVAHKCARTKKLLTELLKIPEFLRYLEEHQHTALKQLQEEFNLYNQQQKQFRIDLTTLEQNLLALANHIENETKPAIPPIPNKKNTTPPIHYTNTIAIKRKAKPGFFERHPLLLSTLIGAGLLLAIATPLLMAGWMIAPAIVAGGISAIGLAIGIKSTIATTVCVGAAGISAYSLGTFIGHTISMAIGKIASIFDPKKSQANPSKQIPYQEQPTAVVPPRKYQAPPKKQSNHGNAFFERRPSLPQDVQPTLTANYKPN